MAEKKITKRDVLNHIIETYANDTMVVEFAKHEIELLDKKNSSKATSKVATENIEVANKIVEVLKETDKLVTVTELLANPVVSEIRVYNEDTKVVDKALTNQKLTYILNHDSRIEKVIDKKKSYFRVK